MNQSKPDIDSPIDKFAANDRIEFSMNRLPQLDTAESSMSNEATSFWALLTSLINDIRHIWNLVQDHPSPFLSGDIQNRILDAIFDNHTLTHLRSQANHTCGAFQAQIYPRMFAQLVAGLVMIHDQLFAMQTSQRMLTPYITPLTELQLKLAIERYKGSELRNNVWLSVEASDFSGPAGLKERAGRIVLEVGSENRE